MYLGSKTFICDYQFNYDRSPRLAPHLKKWLIPHDVVMRWNSTYDMMKFVLAYRVVIDKVTANKGLKLKKVRT